MASEGVVKTATNPQGAGHPGKKGTLRDLFGLAFEGVPSDVLTKIEGNLNSKLGGPQLMDVQRHHRVQDVSVILQLREFLLHANLNASTQA